MHELLATLNDKQRQAVQATTGPVLILAGAGSGKTKTLIHRIAYIIAQKKAKPWNIVAVTFTNKAAQEMKERLQALLGKHITTLPIVGTFHSFCVQILRRDIEQLQLGYTPNFVIYDDNDTDRLIKKCMKDLGFDTKTIAPRGIKTIISQSKNQLKDAATAASEAEEFLEKTAAAVYEKYQQELQASNVVDFDDIIRLTVQLLETKPAILKKYQAAFTYLLVDEYQDTNHAQYMLIQLLAKAHNNICVVGDDFQCVTPETKIKTPTGWVLAKNVKRGTSLLAGAGRGKVVSASVSHIFQKQVETQVYEIRTKKGITLQLTGNHMTFARLQLNSKYHYVYLMFKAGVGYRIGTATGSRFTSGKYQHGLIVRANQERADKIWVLKACPTKKEARYFEMYYAFQYGIPTVVFSAENLSVLDNKDISNLYKNIDTTARVKKLCEDFNIALDYPHHRPSGTTRFQTERKVLRLDWFAHDRITSTKPWHAARLALHSTNGALKKKLQAAGYVIRNAKHGWRMEITRSQFKDIEKIGQHITQLIKDIECVRGAWLNSNKKMLLLPAAHLQPSMIVPILQNNTVIEDEIISVESRPYKGMVLDFNVKDVHNYCANGIVIHNSIYSWRGANMQNILDFEDDYPDAQVILLEQNYRSTQLILEAANEIIKYNTKQKSKILWTENDRGNKLKVIQVLNEQAEGEAIIREIFTAEIGITETLKLNEDSESDELTYINEDSAHQRPESLLDRIIQSQTFREYKLDQQLESTIRKKLYSTNLTDYVILYRTNAQSRALEEAFLKYNVPYRIIGGIKFYERKEVKDMIAYVRSVINPLDWVSLERIVNIPARSLGANSWRKIEALCREKNISYLDLELNDLAALRPQQHTAFTQFQKTMKALSKKAQGKVSASELLTAIMSKTGFADQFNTKLPEDERRLENLEELKSVTKKFDHLEGTASINAFLEEVSLISDQDELDERAPAVNMMTIHAAKGLEFPNVFIAGMEEGLFPHSRSLFNPQEMEEERRLCYVALTRAKHQAYLLYAAQRTVYGNTQITAPSRFIKDLPKDLVDNNIN